MKFYKFASIKKICVCGGWWKCTTKCLITVKTLANIDWIEDSNLAVPECWRKIN